MTLIDYAKYLLNVCGRRFTHLYRRHYLESTPTLPSLSALLSYIKTQTATIYGYLQTRFAGDPTSGIPSITPTQPLTFANLLTNLQKLATRKIDAGASTQIPDGMSLVRLLCDTTAASAVTELIDTNTGWTMGQALPTFPNLSKFTAYFTTKGAFNFFYNHSAIKELSLPNLVSVSINQSNPHFISNCSELESVNMPNFEQASGGWMLVLHNLPKLRVVNLPKLKYVSGDHSNILGGNNLLLEEVYLPSLEATGSVDENYNGYGSFLNCPSLKKIVFGKWPDIYYRYGQGGQSYSRVPGTHGIFMRSPLLLHLEIGQGSERNIYLNYWSPTLTDTNRATFLTNFRQYLFLRLADRTSTTALTLTLSSAVYTALTTETSTLAELGITTLTDKEQAAGITLATAYNTWLDTYRAAINWNITNAG